MLLISVSSYTVALVSTLPNKVESRRMLQLIISLDKHDITEGKIYIHSRKQVGVGALEELELRPSQCIDMVYI